MLLPYANVKGIICMPNVISGCNDVMPDELKEMEVETFEREWKNTEKLLIIIFSEKKEAEKF